MALQFTHAARSPDIIAQEIADDLESALEQFTKIAARLAKKSASTEEEVEAVQD
jgi:hypothetical protein